MFSINHIPPIKTPCPICNGCGWLWVNNIVRGTIKCNNCNGSGLVKFKAF